MRPQQTATELIAFRYPSGQQGDVPLGMKSASAAIHQECSQPFEPPTSSSPVASEK